MTDITTNRTLAKNVWSDFVEGTGSVRVVDALLCVHAYGSRWCVAHIDSIYVGSTIHVRSVDFGQTLIVVSDYVQQLDTLAVWIDYARNPQHTNPAADNDTSLGSQTTDAVAGCNQRHGLYAADSNQPPPASKAEAHKHNHTYYITEEAPADAELPKSGEVHMHWADGGYMRCKYKKTAGSLDVLKKVVDALNC